jgi:putative heme-binding domain-containing protein
VVAYVRSSGRTGSVSLPGDPAKGKAIHEKSDCAKCHAIQGQGDFVGPELTDVVGARRGAARLRRVLLHSASAKTIDSAGYLTFLIIQVATRDGRLVRGLRLNEDTFTVQIRDSDNHLHSFPKDELMELKREPGASVMPGYANLLSVSEIDAPMAFLGRFSLVSSLSLLSKIQAACERPSKSTRCQPCTGWSQTQKVPSMEVVVDVIRVIQYSLVTASACRLAPTFLV